MTTTHHAEQVCQCVEQQLCSVSVHIRKGLLLASADAAENEGGGWCLQSGHSSAFLLRSSPPPHGCLGDNCSCPMPHTLSIIAANQQMLLPHLASATCDKQKMFLVCISTVLR